MASRTIALAVLCVALVATYLAGAEARSAAFGRSLQQTTCSDAKALQGQCDALCKCVADQPEYKGSGRKMEECTGPCNACAEATKNCMGDALPSECTSYAGDSAVKTCIGSSGRK